jgi:nucleoside-diphosphate-sugar epimerase
VAQWSQARQGWRPNHLRLHELQSPVKPGNRSVLVVGAASQIGYHLLPLLVKAGWNVGAVSRFSAPRDPRAAKWHRLDLAEAHALRESGLRPASVISLAPLRILPPLVSALAGLGTTRVIAFSSTSRFTKSGSADPNERELAATFSRSEEALAAQCERHGIRWTVFRPTLVYSPGLDRNISEIARFIERIGFFPILGEGLGKRQPVHAADLAAACLAALAEGKAFDRAYNLSGGETLTYREMVERIFRGLGHTPRIVRVSPHLFKAAVSAARVVPRFRKLSPELVTRMNMDMCFDHVEATRNLGFSPRSFEFRLDDSEPTWKDRRSSGYAR